MVGHHKRCFFLRAEGGGGTIRMRAARERQTRRSLRVTLRTQFKVSVSQFRLDVWGRNQLLAQPTDFDGTRVRAPFCH